jgi:type III pantothenate kinase
MTPDLVVDVGNSRIKWGRCLDGRVSEYTSLAADFADWSRMSDAWKLLRGTRWVVSSVQPPRCTAFVEWANARGDRAMVLDSVERLPIRIRVAEPARVGMDRLLDAVAAQSRCSPGTPAIIVDAGSAVTVDWLDESGAFSGGAIFPGVRLMAKSLHEHTALLPLVSVQSEPPELPGTSTPDAIKAGIHSAVVGGVRHLIERLGAQARSRAKVFVTGGDGALVAGSLGEHAVLWPEMTLEGIRLAAEALSQE